MKTNITFVTSFIDIYENHLNHRNIEWRYKRFRELAELGIQIYIFRGIRGTKVPPDAPSFSGECVGDENGEGNSKEEFDGGNTEGGFEEEFDGGSEEGNTDWEKNVYWDTLDLNETWVYKTCEILEYSLPYHRNEEKDTAEYMWLMNSKAEYLQRAIEKNPWKSTHFAWIDFSISYIFKDKERTLEHLKILAQRHFQPSCLVIPGCWDKLQEENEIHIINHIHWRFCGGFILGDIASILQLFELYKTHFAEFIKTHKKLVWEVNFWAWLELKTGWRPTWYSADHNDRILDIPANICCMNLSTTGRLHKTHYMYPEIAKYEPGSASYVYYNGQHILNTRYVNYWCMDNGCYSIQDEHGVIKTINIMSSLDEDTMKPNNYNMMNEGTIGLPSINETRFCGLEDIRLYIVGNVLKFIAMNINYSPTGYNRMVIGEYDIQNYEYKNAKVIFPPYDTVCEKNWIPLVKNGEEYFIYKWFPMEIGKINGETNVLEIVKKYEIKSPWFHKIRGSTTFVEKEEGLVGVVHFSEETAPRRYYHMLVVLSKDTFEPVKYSELFYFQHLGIEFCIGFTIEKNDYLFWISRMDREPVLVRVPMDGIDIKYNIV